MQNMIREKTLRSISGAGKGRPGKSTVKEKYLHPLARLIRNTIKYRYALIRSKIGSEILMSERKSLFVIGCGRSGTTVLGSMLEEHPDVFYYFEPWHLWAAVDSRLDLINLHTSCEAIAICDETLFSKNARSRFNRLFYGNRRGASGKLLVEKTPFNSLRIRYLEALVPNAFYIHIVRDGVEVVESINQLATNNAYAIANMKHFNQWWGNKLCKWEAIKRDGVQIGFFADEVGKLVSNRQRGAYEWLLSLELVGRHRRLLGTRFMEIKYADLVQQPTKVLETIANQFDIRPVRQWIENASRLVIPMQNNFHREPLVLPLGMCNAFNEFQEKYGFQNRAIPENGLDIL